MQVVLQRLKETVVLKQEIDWPTARDGSVTTPTRYWAGLQNFHDTIAGRPATVRFEVGAEGWVPSVALYRKLSIGSEAERFQIRYTTYVSQTSNAGKRSPLHMLLSLPEHTCIRLGADSILLETFGL